MSHLRTSSLRVVCFVAFTALPGLVLLEGKDFPANACTLLPASEVSKVLNQAFESPSRAWAPVVAPSAVKGTDCKYQGPGGSELLFRIYVETSVTVAKDMFTKLSTRFGPNKALEGAWDEAYFDSRHALHVRKGKERYFLRLKPVGSDVEQTERHLRDIATWVAGQL